MLTETKSSSKFISAISKLPVCNDKTRLVIEYGLVIFAIGYSVYLYWLFALDFYQWDFLLLTGVACFYIGLKEVGFLKERFENTLKRLIERGVVDLKEGQSFDGIKKQFEITAHTWMRVTGLICGIAMLVAFIVALTLNFRFDLVLLGIAEVIGAYIAGNYIGRMILYGRLGTWLSETHKNYTIDPSHVDGLSGLKPVGEYYFYQASIASIPAIFLAVWWLLIPIWPRDYSYWHDVYFGLLVIAILIEIFAFLSPLFSFHRLMNKRKKILTSEADILSVSISELKSNIAKNQDIEKAKILKDQLDEINARYWAIENMKTWPVDVKTKKRFSVNNILLFLPVIYNSINHTFKFDDLFKALSKIQ
jgi:hypothetical protein